MGISFSSSHSSPPSPSPTCGMDELPESCVALIMEYLDPPQICKLATLTRTFRAASSADFVWESKLPSNYHVLVRQIFNGLPTDFEMEREASTLHSAEPIPSMEAPRNFGWTRT
ncbi:F-box protein [Arachis hypogaea]|nr:F-box protein [Arachis hypogaea]